MKKVWEFVKSLDVFLIFLAICCVFGKYSIFIRWQNIGLSALLVLCILVAIFRKDIAVSISNIEDEE